MELMEGTVLLDAPTPRHHSECVVENWLYFLGHRWNALILWHLSTGPKRFAELSERLPGISPKVLTERLVAMAEWGLVKRATSASFPRGTSYALTARGAAVVRILDQFEQLEPGIEVEGGCEQPASSTPHHQLLAAPSERVSLLAVGRAMKRLCRLSHGASERSA